MTSAYETEVAVPVRGAGCIICDECDAVFEEPVAVPVRGAGCIGWLGTADPGHGVAVPVRGTGCICKRIQTRISIFVGSSQPVSVV